MEDQLKEAKGALMQGLHHYRVTELKAELYTLLAKEERLWRQRSQVDWLRVRDRNTRYFHCRATQRQRRNYVTRLKNQASQWTTTHDQVPPLFIEYYNSLFQTVNPEQVEEVVEDIQKVITEEMNSQLVKEFTAEEVQVALKQMAPIKPPGPDGLPPIFLSKILAPHRQRCNISSSHMSQFGEDPKSNQPHLYHPHSESSESGRSDGIPPYKPVQCHLQTHFEDPSKQVENTIAHDCI